MSNVKDRANFDRLDNQIWKKTKIDEKGRTVLPKKLRLKLGLNSNSEILWISINRCKQDNLYSVEIGVKNDSQPSKR